MGNIIVFKTIVSEEIIAELINETSDEIIVSRPRIFQVLYKEDGSTAPSLAPYFITDPDNRSVPIKSSYIVSRITAPLQIERAYLATVSPIDTTTKIQLS